MSQLSPTSATLSLPPAALSPRPEARRAASGFGANLERATTRQEVHAAAEKLVSTAFIAPLLAQARQNPFKSELFHGGRGEEIFGQRLDQIHADQIARSTNFAITDAIVNHFLGPKAPPPLKVDLRG